MSHRDLLFGDYVVPRTRLKFGERAFSIAAPRAWNRLPTELKLMRSTPAAYCSSSDRTNLDNVMRRRSSCSRRTKSTVDLI